MLSVFWISNANNAINNNAAIGGEAGFWTFAHVGVNTTEFLRLKVKSKIALSQQNYS